MKSIGIVRRVDKLGRIVLPRELRTAYDLEDGNAVEFLTGDDMIILKKLQCSCVFCKSNTDLVEYMGKTICLHCLDEIERKIEKINNT